MADGPSEDQRQQTAGPEPTKTINLEPVFSCLTTTELQQNLKQLKQSNRRVRLLFEIPSARIVERTLTKYVVYRVVVMRSGSYDSARVSVERRYSDFQHFHQQLLEEFSEELEEVQFPRKRLSGNFDPEVIAGRRAALQDFLTQTLAVRGVRHSRLFPAFFSAPEQRSALGLLRAGQYRAAQAQLRDALGVLEKVGQWQSPALLVPALCALAVCHRDGGQLEDAWAAAIRALPAARRCGPRAYRAPLLELLVDLGYALRRPTAALQEELRRARAAERGAAAGSLKELLVLQVP